MTTTKTICWGCGNTYQEADDGHQCPTCADIIQRADAIQTRVRLIAPIWLTKNNGFFRASCGACGASHKDQGVPAWLENGFSQLCHHCAVSLRPELAQWADELGLLMFCAEDETVADAIVSRVLDQIPLANQIDFGQEQDITRIREIMSEPGVRELIEKTGKHEAERKHAAEIDGAHELPF